MPGGIASRMSLSYVSAWGGEGTSVIMGMFDA